MNGNIKRLLQIAEKDSRDITGTMSGTSLDGLDIAYCNIKGEGRTTQVDLLHVKTIYYPKKLKEEVTRIFEKLVGEIELLTQLNPWLGSCMEN